MRKNGLISFFQGLRKRMVTELPNHVRKPQGKGNRIKLHCNP